jgi:chemotaxis protein methyltransferase CheR
MSWPYDPGASVALLEEEYRLLREFIRARVGLDFGPPRRDILAARLRKRLEALSLRSFLEYYHYLLYAKREQRDRELDDLAGALANHETYFFREAYQFELLFHDLWKEVAAPVGQTTRILSAGCSSGEEVYSLAISALERQLLPEGRVEIAGVDLCRTPIDTARRGVYRRHSFRVELPFPVDRYFTPVEVQAFQVKPRVREMLAFYQGNILDNVWMEGLGAFDAIFCRNVLIYFDEAGLSRASRIFHRLLKPRGYLFLGHSESFLGKGFPFEAVRAGQCIVYRRLG